MNTTHRPDTVGAWMTAGAHTIGAQQTLAAAHDAMKIHSVRHLPVLDAGELVGIISERDLAIVETLPGVTAHDVKVEEAMAADVLVTAPDERVGPLAAKMAARKVGSAIAVTGDRVVGVFTTVDALRALANAFGAR